MQFTNINKGVSKQQEFTENVVNLNNEKLYSQYGRFLEEAPIYCKKYYKQSKINTTTDEGFGNVELNLGETSPLRFNKISNVPLYGISDSQFDIDDDDVKGIKMEYHNEAVIPPKIFQPIPNDYFVIEISGRELLFKVIDVSYENIKSNPFYKIEFKFDKYFDDTIEKQVSDEYMCIFNNIGTEDTPLIKKSDFLLIDDLKEVYNGMYDKYIKSFFYVNADCVLYKNLLYDPYLTKFIKDNVVFKKDNNSFQYLVLIQKIEDDKLDISYIDTIYDIIERKVKDKFKNKFIDLNILNDTSYLGIAGNHYKSVNFPKYNNTNDILYHNKYLDDNLYDNIVNNRMYIIQNQYYHLYNILIKYMNDDRGIIEYIKNNQLRYIDADYFEYFILIPIVLYIIKKIIGNILINYNNKEDKSYV